MQHVTMESDDPTQICSPLPEQGQAVLFGNMTQRQSNTEAEGCRAKERSPPLQVTPGL